MSALVSVCSSIAALCGIQVSKYLLSLSEKSHRNSFLNINENIIVSSLPFKTKYTEDKDYDYLFMGPLTCYPGSFSKWDFFTSKGPLTIQQIENMFSINCLNSRISFVANKKVIIYNCFDQNHQRFRSLSIQQIMMIKKYPLPKNKKFIMLDVCFDITGRDDVL